VPLPWAGAEPPYCFSPLSGVDGWLPAPGAWRGYTVEAQDRDPASTLALYRRALELRRALPALGDGELAWHQAPEGVLVFTRAPGFVCTVNTGDRPVLLPSPGTAVLASGGLLPAAGDEQFELAPDTAVWWTAAA
jgi:alpha-glucosidase